MVETVSDVIKRAKLTEEGLIPVPGLMSRWVRLANGAKVHYATAGDTGPAVILLHGGIQGSSGIVGWRFMAPFLGDHGFRVYCPDQLGYGLTDPRPQYRPILGGISQMHFVNDFADALCMDRFHLGGNSMGTQNALLYLVNHPERVINYAVVASSGLGDLYPRSMFITPKMSKLTPNPDYVSPPFDGTEESMRVLMEGIIIRKDAISPGLVAMRTLAANYQREASEMTRQMRERIADDPNIAQLSSLKNRLENLTIKGIYLYGKQDVRDPLENGYRQEDIGLKNLQFFYPDECGHQGQTDQPELFNQVFLEFFRDGKVSRKTAEWAGVSKRRPENPDMVEQVAPIRSGR